MSSDQIITILIPTLTTTIVGIILLKQIKTQQEIIKNYEGYMKAIDWKNVKSYYEELVLPKEKETIEKKIENELNEFLDKEMGPEFERIHEQLNELAHFAAANLLRMGKVKAQLIMQELLPTSQKMLSESLNSMWDRNNNTMKES